MTERSKLALGVIVVVVFVTVIAPAVGLGDLDGVGDWALYVLLAATVSVVLWAAVKVINRRLERRRR